MRTLCYRHMRLEQGDLVLDWMSCSCVVLSAQSFLSHDIKTCGCCRERSIGCSVDAWKEIADLRYTPNVSIPCVKLRSVVNENCILLPLTSSLLAKNIRTSKFQ